MILVLSLLAAAAALVLLWLLALRGRSGHPGLKDFRGIAYAHRGLYGKGIPENSMAAFRAALEHGYGIELDVHLLKDGSLAIMHDSDLKRTTGREGILENLTRKDLPDYPLEGTGELIPLFSQVLALFQGKRPLIVELKPRDGNCDALTRAACQLLDTYAGPYCLESFDPRCVRWLKKNRPELIRGQLSEDFLKSSLPVPKILKWLQKYNLSLWWTSPDFVAYRFSDRKILSNTICRKLWHMEMVSWTVKSREEYHAALQEGWIPIFEGFLP